MRDITPGSSTRDTLQKESRLRELDRKQAGIAADVSYLPRGIVAWHRRTTGRSGLQGTVHHLIASLGCIIKTDRNYIIKAKMGVNNVGSGNPYPSHTLISGLAFGTIDGSEPSPSSSVVFAGSNIYLDGGGRTHHLFIDSLLDSTKIKQYTSEASVPLRLLFTLLPLDAAPMTYNFFADSNSWPAEFMVIDMGTDIGTDVAAGVNY